MIDKVEKFKAQCMLEKDIHDSRMARWNQLKEEQKKYLPKCYAPKTKWFSFKAYCPICKEPLMEEVIREYCSYGDSFQKDVILTCGCGYEYAGVR